MHIKHFANYTYTGSGKKKESLKTPPSKPPNQVRLPKREFPIVINQHSHNIVKVYSIRQKVSWCHSSRNANICSPNITRRYS